ncbi:hypothetical protein EYC84_001296 [Monilinia fructicola]|uniref:Uncharacterized protein n=1 Tax=Monilinia fructicola TaxID=38448 RepID=A0A5M9JNY4_MONFR|nr:hypothetical protein EYC84_001296 [Monilinia fructicola]
MNVMLSSRTNEVSLRNQIMKKPSAANPYCVVTSRNRQNIPVISHKRALIECLESCYMCVFPQHQVMISQSPELYWS